MIYLLIPLALIVLWYVFKGYIQRVWRKEYKDAVLVSDCCEAFIIADDTGLECSKCGRMPCDWKIIK